MKNTILHINDQIYRACIWISGLSILFMALIVPWGIFTRYVLGTGSGWPEPIATILMVVFTFFGASATYRAHGHIAVAMLTERLPKVPQAALALAMEILMLVVAVFMTWFGTKLCLETMNQVIGQLPWMPVGLTYLPVPLGGLTTLLFVLERLAFGTQKDRAIVTIDHEKKEGAH